jgi:hypothetical protein
MTRVAIGWQARILPAAVAVLAQQCRMRAVEWKLCCVVIEEGAYPGNVGMTQRAVLRKPFGGMIGVRRVVVLPEVTIHTV